MPLLPGKKNIGHNIEVEQAAGKPRRQAIAIALNTARKSGVPIPKKGKSTMKDKSPYNRRAEKDEEKAFKAVAKSVKPVAKDTNKTRRPKMKAGKEISEPPAKRGKCKGY